MVDLSGFEPLAFAMRMRRSPTSTRYVIHAGGRPGPPVLRHPMDGGYQLIR